MKQKINVLLIFLLSLRVIYGQPEPLYLDASQPIDVRVEDLLSRMTLEEKVGQLNMPCVLPPFMLYFGRGGVGWHDS